MKATELIKKLQDIIDKKQKDFNVKFDDGFEHCEIDDIRIGDNYILII